jgi:hypothetical protein
VTVTHVDPPDDELERLLRDLGAHLDLGPGGTAAGRADLVIAVLAGIDNGTEEAAGPDPGAEVAEGRADPDPDAEVAAAEVGSDSVDGDLGPARVGDLGDRVGRRAGAADRRGRRASRVLVAAAVVVGVLAVLLAVTPTREAIADWFGIGAVRITRSDGPLTTGDPTAPTTAARPTVDIDDLPGLVPFEVRLPDPDRFGDPAALSVDPDVPSGLVEARYPTFTLAQMASTSGGAPVMAKTFASRDTTVTSVTVRGQEGLWLSGDVHEVAEVGPDGEVETDTTRRVGNVLVWEDDGVTYRIEGLDTLDAALSVAASIG